MASRQTPPPKPKRHSGTAASPSSSGSAAATPPSSSSKYNAAGKATPTSALRRESSADSHPPTLSTATGARPKENVTVTVRFRPLSAKETSQGEEIAWYADGQMIARNENNPSIAYAYDRVFGPTTTTRHVYDVAAQQVVSASMEGINGTIFAYGVTSSGKTHTMLGDQRSPGIIPLAVKDVFSIIQETPSREFLLRVSYLEIYNEVVNDLLNPAGQNLRIREDSQGTFVEGVKEEVVLSPAHALSLIAAGEEHRHVGSNNFNILSSRSHTIFTLTVESSPCGSHNEEDAVSYSQLNLIDLAGSESSKAETTGVRRKEGSYINRSLLTLGTVIAKLTDGKAAHIPYRDSKLTRLLQSSLNGQGRVSLICTVTPSSSNSEETHNTLKFAHRAKHIEIQALQNKIIDEKSLIKKYQNEIRCLRNELEQFRSDDADLSPLKGSGIKTGLEDDDNNTPSRLLLEEEAKAALLGRIQRLTKLILVSTKSTQSPKLAQRPGSRLRNSFVEEELAYLPHRRQDMVLENENVDLLASPEERSESTDLTNKEEKKNKKHGLLTWLKLRKRDGNSTTLASSECMKPAGTKSDAAAVNQSERMNHPMEDSCTDAFDTMHSAEVSNENYYLAESSPAYFLSSVDDDGTTLTTDVDIGCKESNGIKLQVGSSTSQGDSTCSPAEDSTSDLLEELHSGEDLNDASSLPQTPPGGMNSADRIDLLKEQLKMLSGEAGQTSSISKHPSVDKISNSSKTNHKMDLKKMNGEIKVTREVISPEKHLSDSVTSTPNTVEKLVLSPCYTDVVQQLNEKSFELEVKVADNRIIQDQLQQKFSECEALQKAVSTLKEQLAEALESGKSSQYHSHGGLLFQNADSVPSRNIQTELMLKDQALDIDELKHKVIVLASEKSQLESDNQKLAEECSYAKGLASAAGVELKALSEQVAKLMRQNDKLATELANLRNSSQRRVTNSVSRNGKREQPPKRFDSAAIKREMDANYEKEQMLETDLRESEKREVELQRIVEESKQKEAYLESEMANMWVVIAKLRKSQGIDSDEVELGIDQ